MKCSYAAWFQAFTSQLRKLNISALSMFFLWLCVPWAVQAASVAVRTELPVQIIPAAEHNHSTRLPNVLVLHYTHCTLAEAFEHYQQGHVSAHYTVDRDGTIYQHVDELEAAHHAGLSYWRRASVNQSSIGIEIVNTGPLEACDVLDENASSLTCAGGQQWEAFAENQIHSVIALCQDILKRYAMDPFDVVGHADVAPQRKDDPGPAFPWLRLTQSGIGVAYDVTQGALVYGKERYLLRLTQNISLAEVQEQLASLGYAVPQHGEKDTLTSRVLIAFNSHYLKRYDSELSDETLAVLDALWRWRRERNVLIIDPLKL